MASRLTQTTSQLASTQLELAELSRSHGELRSQLDQAVTSGAKVKDELTLLNAKHIGELFCVWKETSMICREPKQAGRIWQYPEGGTSREERTRD